MHLVYNINTVCTSDFIILFHFLVLFKTMLKTNIKKNFHQYQKAAEGGNVEAMSDLAFCYDNGEGTEKDLGKAFHWYQKAVEGGNEEVMSNLAFCYYNGEGTEKDL